MKTWGIISVVIGALNFFAAGAISTQNAAAAGSKFSAALMFLALGAFLIYRANQKKKGQDDKDKWNK